MSSSTFRKVGHGTFVNGRLVTAQQSDIRVAIGRRDMQYAPIYVRDQDLDSPPPTDRLSVARQRLNELIELAQAKGQLDAKSIEQHSLAILQLLD